ncbi:MAG TPA: hypothetical protein DCE78_05615 [Bacteroidetes bacterium]|nr:hypothetical protein [Bacteroidota bacterium]
MRNINNINNTEITMKHSIGILTTLTLIAALVVSGCDSPSKKMENAKVETIEANRDLEIAKSEVEAEFRIFKTENSTRINEYNRTMSDIKQKIQNETNRERRVVLETKLTQHETTHRELQREMDNYRVSGRENWDDFKLSFNEKMDDLDDSLDNFFSTPRTSN